MGIHWQRKGPIPEQEYQIVSSGLNCKTADNLLSIPVTSQNETTLSLQIHLPRLKE